MSPSHSFFVVFCPTKLSILNVVCCFCFSILKCMHDVDSPGNMSGQSLSVRAFAESVVDDYLDYYAEEESNWSEVGGGWGGDLYKELNKTLDLLAHWSFELFFELIVLSNNS